MFRALRLRAFSASEFSSDVTAAMAPEMPLRGGGGGRLAKFGVANPPGGPPGLVGAYPGDSTISPFGVDGTAP